MKRVVGKTHGKRKDDPSCVCHGSPQQKSLTESRSAIIIKWIMGIPMLPAKFAGRMGEQMIKSMTGFGRCEICEDNRKFTVEMKSVNHRYLDVNLKMPKKLNFFEAAIRNLLKEYIQRGKVDVFITYEAVSYTHLRAHETDSYLVCRLLLEKKKKRQL